MARRIGRRFFLTGAGGLLLGLPILTSLVPRRLAAAPTGAPKRFFALLSQSGQPAQHWYPTHTPAGYQLTDAVFSDWGSCPKRPCKQDGTTYLHGQLPEDNRYGYAPLTEFQTDTGISAVLNEALNPFLEKMTLLRGIDFLFNCGHNKTAYLGNYNGCTNETARAAIDPIPTIDEVMAYSDKVYSVHPPVRALHMATGFPGAGSATDYGIPGGAVEELDGYIDPLPVWQQLFMGLAPQDGPPEVDPNLSLLNGVYEDYQRFSKNSRLGADDRQLLDRHVSFLSEIEAGIKSFQAVQCTPPGTPSSIKAGTKLVDPEQLRTAVELLVDLAAAALICDLTRVVTLKITNALHDGNGSWQTSVHNSADIPSDWHHYAHDAYSSEASMRNLLALNHWIASEVFARILTKLDVVENTDGATVLDNSLVVWGNELGLGHTNMAMPTLLAGSAGGAIRTNRYIDYSNWDGDYANPTQQGVLIPGVPHNRFLVTCMQAMGLSPIDYERDGQEGYGYSSVINPPNGLTSSHWDLAHVADPLPGVMTA